MVRISAWVCLLSLLLAGCVPAGSRPAAAPWSPHSAPSANAQIIDGEGRVQAYLDGRLEALRLWLTKVARMDPTVLSGVTACPAYDEEMCKELGMLSNSERILASEVAVEGAALATALLPSLKIRALPGQLTTEGPNGPYRVNVRNSPAISNQIDVGYEVSLAALEDRRKAFRLDHDILHQVFLRLTLPRFGFPVEDNEEVNFVPGRRLIDRSVADAMIQYLFTLPAPGCAVGIVGDAITVYQDIDGKPMHGPAEVTITVLLKAEPEPTLVELTMNGIDLKSVVASRTLRQFKATLYTHLSYELRAKVQDDFTGRTATCEAPVPVALKPVPRVTVYRMRYRPNPSAFIYQTSTAPPADWASEGAVFELISKATPLCTHLVLMELVRFPGGVLGRISRDGSVLGWTCDGAPGLRTLRQYRQADYWFGTTDPKEATQRFPTWIDTGIDVPVF
jgi:hypothetical protein